jgi:hypothetical protein
VLGMMADGDQPSYGMTSPHSWHSCALHLLRDPVTGKQQHELERKMTRTDIRKWQVHVRALEDHMDTINGTLNKAVKAMSTVTQLSEANRMMSSSCFQDRKAQEVQLQEVQQPEGKLRPEAQLIERSTQAEVLKATRKAKSKVVSTAAVTQLRPPTVDLSNEYPDHPEHNPGYRSERNAQD